MATAWAREWNEDEQDEWARAANEYWSAYYAGQRRLRHDPVPPFHAWTFGDLRCHWVQFVGHPFDEFQTPIGIDAEDCLLVRVGSNQWLHAQRGDALAFERSMAEIGRGIIDQMAAVGLRVDGRSIHAVRFEIVGDSA